MAKKYWLMKTEPQEFSFEDLKRRKGKTEPWHGVRNYQARNFMRDEMKKGDEILFYHSGCPQPGVVGLAYVGREAYPDPTAFDPDSKYFDGKSSAGEPRWFMVEVTWLADFKRMVPLSEIREQKSLIDMKLVQRGQRLSIQPVTKEEFKVICSLGGKVGV